MIEIKTWQSPYTGVIWKTCDRCGLFQVLANTTRTTCGPCEDCGGACEWCARCTGIKTQ
jgi:hypothetical protein